MTDPSAASADADSSARDIELDTAALRVLAHPLRLNVLSLLRERGPSTAGRIAGELGINPGAASYHLRRLAAGGLIVEEPGRGTGRERWWRSAHRQSIHDPAAASGAERETGLGYTHAVALAAADRLRRSAQELPRIPGEWLDVITYSDFLLRLTPADVHRMRAEIFEVIERYRADGGESEGAVPVALQLQAFPVPGTARPPAGDE
ncbi:helix-turn-helix domain-containing protein [Streptomyces albidoflavus]|uniref:ArsR/SmtB family transcription factor n=1 Tax=Streptomyces TaxID=1883 RepID=UPI00101E4715|nr:MULTISPECIES: helix-turn-helix domain-containing protein [Streptomyces]MCO6752026.1 helix-turn-helix domain-containing protein [Streptomyces sp. IpFD-1.1]RZE56502.1 ArsR family transcriptional regulator [Streptomyces albidoflavus]RZE68652.1 ArsR family transcriptional regulator [Streptomyces albidoflavus]